ncbi:LexA family transcriptional regulator [Laribacter hongkongensis]|uniref:Helix-turn-helix transcriptional regulator n=1 Tax=Laribacter hongkongensis TaxID=168471 RepID=A0ABD4STJ0_9NEIS|nr:helix-turn-helix transcriptional regulator [Laribacter hongkongensis]MCG9027050.1 helix-turn-helix transcriptional regulator [Laribacter hongkongensis]MCG9031582.1 helix-turn-helix transcriptional regulator [Laribacter hongkongensis]MCG9093000.1 helix-turn-helix transcriptional regulator [Laribacter hongkongensis]
MTDAKPKDENLCASLSGRIEHLTELCGGPGETARKVGVSNTTLQRWRNGEVDLSTSNLVKLADAAGVTVEWLATGRGKMRADALPVTEDPCGHQCPCVDTLGNPVNLTDFVFVPRYNLKASAGHGLDANGEKPIFSMAFRRYWIDNFLRLDPHNLSVLSVRGDSMEGVLNDRDVILIDHADNTPKEGVYVLRIDGDLIVKRVQRKPGGKIGIISANEAYDTYDVDMNAPPQDFAIIGRVVWFGRQL